MQVQSTEESAIAKAHSKPWFYATKPSRWTVFLRTFVPWQVWRFMWINLKMLCYYPAQPSGRIGTMPEWLELVLFFAAYFALMRWILPRFGVPT